MKKGRLPSRVCSGKRASSEERPENVESIANSQDVIMNNGLIQPELGDLRFQFEELEMGKLRLKRENRKLVNSLDNTKLQTRD